MDSSTSRYFTSFIRRQFGRDTIKLTSQRLLYLGGANKISETRSCKTIEYLN